MAARSLARTSDARAKITFYVFFVIALFLLYRLYRVQVQQGPDLAEQARAQHIGTIEFSARRGAIVDRDGTPLVRSLPSESIYAVPPQVKNKDAAAAALARILHRDAAGIDLALHDSSQFRWIARKVSRETVARVRSLHLAGIAIKGEDTGMRVNIAGRLASNVLGFVGLEESGLDGAEYAFDAILRGTAGSMTMETDQFGTAIPFGQTTVVKPAHPGKTLRLTIDSFLQFQTERALQDTMKQWHARSATAVVMDPRTGEILAMANAPDYEPANYGRYSSDAWRNRAVMDAYEPGSTFKLVTAAAALDAGIAPDARFPAKDELVVGGRTIHNAEDGEAAGNGPTESIEDIIAHSHNVGAAEIGAAVGPTRMAKTIAAFGFGTPTHVDLPGENPGIVPPTSEWSGSSLATISFGHGISTTPIALIRAYCAIANGGILMRPRIASAILAPDGTVVYRYPAEIEGRAISANTAAILRSYLRAVVLRGTGNPSAKVPGYTTAGKTGTAQVVENGRYLPGAYIASFIGMIPAEAPRFVILVKVERPVGAIYGGVVAAPAFRRIAQAAMLHAGVMPEIPPAAPTRRLGARSR